MSEFFTPVCLAYGKLEHYLEILSQPFTASQTEAAQAEQDSQSKPVSVGVDDRQDGKLENIMRKTVCC